MVGAQVPASHHHTVTKVAQQRLQHAVGLPGKGGVGQQACCSYLSCYVHCTSRKDRRSGGRWQQGVHVGSLPLQLNYCARVRPCAVGCHEKRASCRLVTYLTTNLCSALR